MLTGICRLNHVCVAAMQPRQKALTNIEGKDNKQTVGTLIFYGKAQVTHNLFVGLFGILRLTREFFTHMGKSQLPVKGFIASFLIFNISKPNVNILAINVKYPASNLISEILLIFRKKKFT